MSNISSIGVGSGLPLDSLLNDLRKAENYPLQLIEQREDVAQNRLSSYGVLKNALDGLQRQTKELAQANTLVALKANSTHEGVKVKANNQAIAGNYQVEVLQTAKAQELISQGYEKKDSALVSENTTLTITLNDGSHETLKIKAGTTLSQLVENINIEPKLGLNATIVNDGSETPYRLMFRARQTGTEGAIQSIHFDNEALNQLFGFNSHNSQPTNYQVRSAENAHVKLNGIDIYSQKNQIQGAITGVDITLAEHSNYDTPFEISISRDHETSKKKISDFINHFNQVIDQIADLTKYDIDSNTGGPLMGDSIARRAKSQITSALHFNLPQNNVSTLSQIGIEIDYITGRLKVNEEALNTALQENIEGVDRLFSDENGLAQRMLDAIQPFIESKGYIDTATEGINTQIKDLKNQYENTQMRIDMRMANFERQFQQLDLLISQMSQTSQYLDQQLGMLANLNTRK